MTDWDDDLPEDLRDELELRAATGGLTFAQGAIVQDYDAKSSAYVNRKAEESTTEMDTALTKLASVGDSAPARANMRYFSTCLRCGKVGHMARDCTEQASKVSTMECFKCGKIGHAARDCPNTRDPQQSICYSCGKSGHLARNCPGRKPEPPLQSRPQRLLKQTPQPRPRQQKQEQQCVVISDDDDDVKGKDVKNAVVIDDDDDDDDDDSPPPPPSSPPPTLSPPPPPPPSSSPSPQPPPPPPPPSDGGSGAKRKSCCYNCGETGHQPERCPRPQFNGERYSSTGNNHNRSYAWWRKNRTEAKIFGPRTPADPSLSPSPPPGFEFTVSAPHGSHQFQHHGGGGGDSRNSKRKRGFSSQPQFSTVKSFECAEDDSMSETDDVEFNTTTNQGKQQQQQQQQQPSNKRRHVVFD